MNNFIQQIRAIKPSIVHELLPSESFFVDKKDLFFAFDGGPVNLFIQKKGGGERTFLAFFTNENLLFSLNEVVADPNFDLLIIPIGKTTLFEFSIQLLIEFIQQNPEQLVPF